MADITCSGLRRTLRCMLEAENLCPVNPKYFETVQRELDTECRHAVIVWMHTASVQCYCHIRVFSSAASLLDRFLSLVSLPKFRLELVGGACLLISSKFFGEPVIGATQLCRWSSTNFTVQDLLAAEMEVITSLQWNICTITPSDFLEVLLPLSGVSESHCQIAFAIADDVLPMVCSDRRCFLYPPSLRACGIIALCEMKHVSCGAHFREESGIFQKVANLTSHDVDFVEDVFLWMDSLLGETD